MVILLLLSARRRHRLWRHHCHEDMCERTEWRSDVQADTSAATILVAEECLDAGALTWRENHLAAAGGTAVGWVVVEFFEDGVVVDPDFDDDGRLGNGGIRGRGSW
jgi:hypothetical protein